MKKTLSLLTCLLAILMSTGCSSPPPDPISSLALTSMGVKGNFQVELVTGYPDNDYIGNTQTWCYNVTVLADKGDLSHWCLDLCDEPEHQVLNWSGPAERIEHTAPTWNEGAYGHIIKWDGTSLEPGESAVFCFTLAGIWESDQVEWFASDGAPWGEEDPKFADTGWTVGPSCGSPCTPPAADFNANENEICAGDEVIFTDASAPGDITAWNWTFSGGNPLSADTQGPHAVTYENPGIFIVSLIVTNACGSHTKTETGYITVESCLPPPQAYNLTISSTIGGSAAATINPTTVVGPGETKTILDIPADTAVNLEASPHTGYEFVSWTGDPTDGITDITTTITMQDNYEITANFKALSEPPVKPPDKIVVGWKSSPVNKLAVLTPWIALFATLVAGTTSLALKRRKA